jgi:hypothetical protein
VMILNPTEAKETYYRGKRDLLQRQKRPNIEEAQSTWCVMILNLRT